MGSVDMSYYQYQQANDMSYYTPHTQDMSSYVAVQGTPRKDNSYVFGLTPKEVRYLRSKFHSSRRPSDPSTTPPQQPSHGVCVQANPIVVLNALGYIGFKVVSTCGDAECYLWTVERNLDADLDLIEAEAVKEAHNELKELKNKSKSENGSGKGGRRHSLAATLN